MQRCSLQGMERGDDASGVVKRSILTGVGDAEPLAMAVCVCRITGIFLLKLKPGVKPLLVLTGR